MRVGVNLAVVAYVLGTTTKRSSTFWKKCTPEIILATPITQLADFPALKFNPKYLNELQQLTVSVRSLMSVIYTLLHLQITYFNTTGLQTVK